jgi:hypothetical protein
MGGNTMWTLPRATSFTFSTAHIRGKIVYRRGITKIMAEAIRGMKESLDGITDSRRQRGNLLRNLTDVPVIALTTIVAGWDEFTMMEEFGNAKQDFFKQFLALPHGIPDDLI